MWVLKAREVPRFGGTNDSVDLMIGGMHKWEADTASFSLVASAVLGDVTSILRLSGANRHEPLPRHQESTLPGQPRWPSRRPPSQERCPVVAGRRHRRCYVSAQGWRRRRLQQHCRLDDDHVVASRRRQPWLGSPPLSTAPPDTSMFSFFCIISEL